MTKTLGSICSIVLLAGGAYWLAQAAPHNWDAFAAAAFIAINCLVLGIWIEKEKD